MVRSSSGWKASLRERRFEKVVATFLPFPVLIFFVHAAAEVAGGHVYALKRGRSGAVTRWREKNPREVRFLWLCQCLFWPMSQDVGKNDRTAAI